MDLFFADRLDEAEGRVRQAIGGMIGCADDPERVLRRTGGDRQLLAA
jgi:hypothetical protein